MVVGFKVRRDVSSQWPGPDGSVVVGLVSAGSDSEAFPVELGVACDSVLNPRGVTNSVRQHEFVLPGHDQGSGSQGKSPKSGSAAGISHR